MSSLLRRFQLKVITSLALFLLITAAFAVATYSWYTISTTPQLRAVETRMKVIDPVLSIARATDEAKQPEEVSNRDAEKSLPGGNSPYDTTWGSVITSFQDSVTGEDGKTYALDNGYFKLNYPATHIDPDDPDVKLEKFIDESTMTPESFPSLFTAKVGEDGRLGRLEYLKENDLGEEPDGTYKNNGIRYYTAADGRVCAVGLGVWVRINQEDHDLVMDIRNLSITLATGQEVLNGKNVKAGVRVLNDEEKTAGTAIPFSREDLIMTEYTAKTDTHTAVIYDAAKGRPFPANTPKLLEIVIYMEGNTLEDSGSGKAMEQSGILSKNIGQKLHLNMESVTFYDSVSYITQ